MEADHFNLRLCQTVLSCQQVKMMGVTADLSQTALKPLNCQHQKATLVSQRSIHRVMMCGLILAETPAPCCSRQMLWKRAAFGRLCSVGVLWPLLSRSKKWHRSDWLLIRVTSSQSKQQQRGFMSWRRLWVDKAVKTTHQLIRLKEGKQKL